MSGTAESVWTDDKVKDLRQLVMSGNMPLSRIAGRLALTRSQVAGKIHRSPELKKAFGERRGVTVPPCRHDAVSPQAEHGPNHLSRIGNNQCRWPRWKERTDPEFMNFCGCETAPGKPYCKEHQAKAWGGPPKGRARTEAVE